MVVKRTVFLLLLLLISLAALGLLGYQLQRSQQAQLRNLHQERQLLHTADSLFFHGETERALEVLDRFPADAARQQRQAWMRARDQEEAQRLSALDSLASGQARQDSAITQLRGQLRRQQQARRQAEERAEREEKERLLTEAARVMQAREDREHTAILEARIDSLLQRITQLEYQAEHRGVLRFKSPKGIDIVYIGDFLDELPHGRGVGIWANGTWYEGDWEQGAKHGEGVYQFPAGERYSGTFRHNQRCGFGTYIWKNGDTYTGYWKDDLRDGEGVIRNQHGVILKQGLWRADQLVSKSEIQFGG